jgi:hypothetical protein
VRPMPDRVLIVHPPAPALMSEQPRGKDADDAVLVGAVVDPIRIHGPTVANRWRGPPDLQKGPGMQLSAPSPMVRVDPGGW